MKVVHVSVRHSSRDPGGGLPVMASKKEGDLLGSSPVGIVGMFESIFVAGAGGGSGGVSAVVHATDGGGMTAVGPRHRHSLLVTLVSGVGVSVVRLVRESYSQAVQSI